MTILDYTRSSQSFCIALIDITFQTINDDFGTSTGNKVFLFFPQHQISDAFTPFLSDGEEMNS
jgi:hypothetical protein